MKPGWARFTIAASAASAKESTLERVADFARINAHGTKVTAKRIVSGIPK
jgi:hypothetical protein